MSATYLAPQEHSGGSDRPAAKRAPELCKPAIRIVGGVRPRASSFARGRCRAITNEPLRCGSSSMRWY